MYKFTPLSSITVYDLAQLIAALHLQIDALEYLQIPDDLKKHFRIVKDSDSEV